MDIQHLQPDPVSNQQLVKERIRDIQHNYQVAATSTEGEAAVRWLMRYRTPLALFVMLTVIASGIFGVSLAAPTDNPAQDGIAPIADEPVVSPLSESLNEAEQSELPPYNFNPCINSGISPATCCQ